MVMEMPRRINESEDLPIEFSCGCKVTFLGSCFLRSSRMDCCANHSKRDQRRTRDVIAARAKRERDRILMFQPPR